MHQCSHRHGRHDLADLLLPLLVSQSTRVRSIVFSEKRSENGNEPVERERLGSQDGLRNLRTRRTNEVNTIPVPPLSFWFSSAFVRTFATVPFLPLIAFLVPPPFFFLPPLSHLPRPKNIRSFFGGL